MSAPKENNYWTFRDKHGRDYKYTPEALEEELVKYAEWVRDNPLYETVLVQKGIKVKDSTDNTKEKTVYTLELPRMRAMTIKGFCLFADISTVTLDNYGMNEDFIDVVTRIRDIIFTQKFEGAAASFLDSRIISMELGLVAKQENKNIEVEAVKVDYK